MMPSLARGTELPPVVLSLTPERIQAFSVLANDRNATHFDDQVARAQGFAGALVHGAITISVVLRTLTANGTCTLGVDDEIELTFVAPVSPNDTLTGRALVVAADHDAITLEVWCENQHHAKVLTGQARIRSFA